MEYDKNPCHEPMPVTRIYVKNPPSNTHHERTTSHNKSCMKPKTSEEKERKAGAPVRCSRSKQAWLLHEWLHLFLVGWLVHKGFIIWGLKAKGIGFSLPYLSVLLIPGRYFSCVIATQQWLASPPISAMFE